MKTANHTTAKPDNTHVCCSLATPCHFPFTEGISLADLIESNYKLLSVLSRLGVNLSFGDVSVAAACKRYGLSTNLFLMICNLYTCPDYKPDTSSLSADDIARTLRYLRLSHNYYMTVQLPKVQRGVAALAGDCNNIQEKVLIKFFDELVAEIGSHFDREERIFATIDRRLAGEGVAECPSLDVDADHDDIGDKIDDIKSIVIKYLPEKCPTELRLEVLMEIYRLREDMHNHILIESRLLEPALKRF